VQPLKDLEDAVEVDLLEADAVVPHADLTHRGVAVYLAVEHPGLDADPRRFAGFVELQPVADEVLQQLPHLQRVGLHGRHRLIPFYGAASLLEPAVQVADHVAHGRAKGDRLEGLGLGGHPREGEQVVDERSHPRRRGEHALDVLAALVAEHRGELPLQAVAEGLDLAERLLQVV
jgi:hypothetical protein